MLVITTPPSIIHVLIDILDVNDNSPSFLLDVQKIEIPETAPAGFRIQIQGATDPDDSKNGTIGNYSLIEEGITVDTETPFRIVQLDDFVFLEVVGKLDREEKEFYSMRMVAEDMGEPPLSSSSLLHIQILDINDNPPDFGTRSLSLHWNGQPTSKLFRLNATDPDSGENGRVSYRILPAGNSEHFEINDDNFLVTRNSTICDPRCEIVIEARDGGIPALTARLNVEVMMDWGNEHEPNINIRFYPSDYPFIVVQPEDVNGKTLAILSLTDPDGPLGPNSTIKIIKGNEKSIFSLISRQSINILTLKNVDLAEKEEYELEFEANDDQPPVDRKSHKKIRIFFKKLSKTTVIRVAKEYRVTVERDTVVGSFVVHVDTNCTEGCRFEMMGSQDLFRIDGNNGIIVTASTLPADVTSYHLPIRIHPPPPSTSPLETDVFITVIPDSAPRTLIRTPDGTVPHLKKAYSFSTWQNVTVGTVVGKMPTGSGYSTVDVDSELGIFPDGSIFVGKAIHRDLVTLPVILKTRNTTQTSLITLLIKSMNLHAPACHASPIRIPEDVNPGSIIGRLRATDRDSGVNGILEYSMDEVGFHVDPETGILRILKEVDAEKRRNLTMEYRVEDYGIPRRSTRCHVEVIIDDVNDNAPEFGSRIYHATISGNSDETVAIIHATDPDMDPWNQKIQYRLLNHEDLFHVDPESGRISTIQRIPRIHGRINVSVEAANVDSTPPLGSRAFLLITVSGSDDVEFHVDPRIIRIFKNDKIGDKIQKIDVTSSESVIWRTDDPRFHVDTKGNVILIQKTSSTLPFHLLLSSRATTREIEFHVEIIDSDRDKIVEAIVEEAGATIELSENWEILRIIGEEDSDDVTGIQISDRILDMGNSTGRNAFVILESKEESAFKIIHVIHRNSTISSECLPSAHLITPPATVILPHGCDPRIPLNSTNLQIHGGMILIPDQSEILQRVEPLQMTLILDHPSDDVTFSTSSILMLLSSIHPIGESFGRVTAESQYRIHYFLIGTDRLSIDSDTGELILRKRFYHNLIDILILAVIPNGIAKAKISIEVIEDRLLLHQSNFLIIPPNSLFSPNSSIGSISIDRDDVIIDVIDDHFYVRNREIFSKNQGGGGFVPPGIFYEIRGIVKKGRLSTGINITLFFGFSNRMSNDELIFEVEENSPPGTVIGEVPDPASKYRLIDPTCGIQIDPNGIIRTTRIFDHEMTSLLKTKMIEIKRNRIWKILIFVEDVNDNSPKILNPPGRIYVEDGLRYQLEYDDVTSDVFFEVIKGDPFGHLEISDSGVISLRSMPWESFNATIRINDQMRNSDDVRIEFWVEEDQGGVACHDQEFFFSQKSTKMKMRSDQKVTWRIVPGGSGSESGFRINPISGEIQNTSESKKDQIVDLKIQVLSYDARETGYCSCRIHVLDSMIPEFREFSMNSTFEFWISESSDRFTEVGRIMGSMEFHGEVFRIPEDQNFTISPFDGRIFTNTPLDYEIIKFYEFDVVTSSMISCHVRINIMDENDEYPRFITGDVVNLKVREELDTVQYPLVIGSSIAEDLDEGQNGIVSYSILSGNTSRFGVNSTTGDIISLAPLDREESSLYELLIEAKDAGIPSLSATSRILIHVEDINDNTPEFDLPSYSIKIPENLSIGTRILKIHASDKDEGSRLLYFMEDKAPFKVDVTSGWITVAGDVDREKNQEFRINVVVTDGERNSSVLVRIEVEDVNDNHPKILNPNLDVYVPHTPPTVIHVINVEDLDSMDHLKFFINDTKFEITDLGEILTTSESTYPCSIRVTVSDEVGHVTSSEYRFYLHPSKDFPVFIEKIKEVSVREHEDQDLAVFKAKGKGVRYSIISKCQKDLEMEHSSGILKTRSSLDRERYSECPVFIVATSFIQNKPLSTITKMTVKIVDINDNDPRFDQEIYFFNVTENSGAVILGNMVARDADANSRIFYDIVEGDVDKEFVILENGQLETIRDLDRESKSEYRLILEAFDDGKPRRRGRCTVVIKVLDEDDNAPRFSRIFHVEVPEDVRIGEEVIQLSASDSDEHSDHRFEFEEEGGIPFWIEEATGKVRVNETLDFEKKSNYRIKVRLTDGAWLIETSLFVNVKDVNDNPPIFEKSEYFFIQDTLNSTLGSIHATDRDSGENGKIRYSMTSPYFRIHPDSGVVTRLRPLPDDLMTVEVIAMDHGIPRLRSSVWIHVVEAEKGRRRRIRKGSMEGEVIGRNMSSEVEVYPRGIVEWIDGNLILKKKVEEEIWIMEHGILIHYDVVEDSPGIQNSEVFLNISSSEPSGAIIHNLKSPGCVEFHDPGSKGFRILKNGSIQLSGPSDKDSRIRVACNNGIWPIHDSGIINLHIQMIKASDDLPHPPRSRRIQKSLPKTMEIRMSSESPPGTILWQKDSPIWMEDNEFLNVTRKNLILKKKLSASKNQFEVFSGPDHHRSTITIITDSTSPACPIFDQEFYFFEKPKNSNLIHDFGLNLDGCKMELEEKNKFFHINGSTLLIIPSHPGSHQISLILKSNDVIKSRCLVLVTVPRITVATVIPTVIFAPGNYSNPIFRLPEGYKLQDSMKSMFSESASGDVRILKRGLGDRIYHLELEKNGKKDKIRIFSDDVEFRDLENIHMIDATNKSIPTSSGIQNIHESTPEDVQPITIDIFSKKSGIPQLILDLRATYPDMRILPVATWQLVEDVQYQMTLGIMDRNGVILTSSEVQKTLKSFFEKRPPPYMEFHGIHDPCDDHCIQKKMCKRILKGGGNSRIRFRGISSMFDFPEKRVECQIMDTVSMDPIDCGTNGIPDPGSFCRCHEGFESLLNCDRVNDVFSSENGHLEIQKSSDDVIKCGGCGSDVEKMEFDFRTKSGRSQLLRVEFGGKQTALVEIISGSITFSISDEFHRPIETRIEKRVNDGRWHRLLIQMSDSGRRISIQIDGRGKEVKSRIALPMLFNSTRIILMTSSDYCFRRLLIQNQFVYPGAATRFFNVTSSEIVSMECQMPTESMMTTVILLGILAVISLIGMVVCLLAIRRRWNRKTTDSGSGWMKATEIDAFAVPRRVKDSDDYDVYGMKSTSTDDVNHIYTTSASQRYQPPIKPYRRDGHINMAYL